MVEPIATADILKISSFGVPSSRSPVWSSITISSPVKSGIAGTTRVVTRMDQMTHCAHFPPDGVEGETEGAEMGRLRVGPEDPWGILEELLCVDNGDCELVLQVPHVKEA